jgi:hypothetical protein
MLHVIRRIALHVVSISSFGLIKNEMGGTCNMHAGNRAT